MTNRTSRVSVDAIVFTLLVAAYVPLRFIIPLPQLVPGQPALTAMLLLSVGVYWWLDFVAAGRELPPSWLQRGKWMVVIFAIGLITLAPMLMIVFVRHQSAPYLWAHDGLVQNEIAVRLTLHGQNPYAADFSQTILAQVPFKVGTLTQNPALYHYVYLPFTFLLPLPFQALAEATLGWFDQRLLFVVLFMFVLALAASLTPTGSRRLLVTMALGLNPLLVTYLIEGRNDVIILFWLVLATALLHRGHWRGAVVAMALACVTKHTAWLIVPFFGLYLARIREGRTWRLGQAALIFGLVVGAILLPWILWDSRAFFEDTFGSILGTALPVYPISGLGFGGWLVSIGLLPSATADFPFWIVQLITFVPLLVWLLIRQRRSNQLPTALSGYALALFVFTFFSRLFNDNYFGFAISLLAVSVFMAGDDEPV